MGGFRSLGNYKKPLFFLAFLNFLENRTISFQEQITFYCLISSWQVSFGTCGLDMFLGFETKIG
jgi:hypothetical protein